jgi:SNF2 family DNA or RNA helicase
MLIDVPLAEYRKAHKEVISKVQSWVTWFEEQYNRTPDISDRENYALTSGFELVSQLRRAAGLAKLHALGEVITEHFEATGYVDTPDGRVYHRPLIVWGHHLDVLHPIADLIAEKLGSVAMIVGSTTDNERDQIVDLFQEGRIPVLVAGITKAGVGLTLTRSSDAYFVELSWVPAEVQQAEDRFHRIGAVNPALYTSMIALGTLDEAIQKVLIRKTKVLEAALGNTDDSVAVMADSDAAGLQEIVLTVIDEAIRARGKH